jgi:hypothetical protein
MNSIKEVKSQQAPNNLRASVVPPTLTYTLHSLNSKLPKRRTFTKEMALTPSSVGECEKPLNYPKSEGKQAAKRTAKGKPRLILKVILKIMKRD